MFGQLGQPAREVDTDSGQKPEILAFFVRTKMGPFDEFWDPTLVGIIRGPPFDRH